MSLQRAEGPAADRTPRTATTTNQVATRIDEDADPEQLTLWAYAIPAHPLELAEWHLRQAVNRLAYRREPRHWWLRDVERRRDSAA